MPSPSTPTASQGAIRPPRARSVFINCPFDPEYQPLLRVICFTVMACGFVPRCALDFNDSGAIRFQEIVKLITGCGFSIHDISRVELDKASKLPRFNMPLELGADLALRIAGPASQRARKTLVLDTEKHRYDLMLSDISGMDIEAHANETGKAMKAVRDWLNANRGDQPILPGAKAIIEDHAAYLQIAPDIILALCLDAHDDLPHRDYLDVVEQALPQIEKARKA
jgi:hypothetical protein